MAPATTPLSTANSSRASGDVNGNEGGYDLKKRRVGEDTGVDPEPQASDGLHLQPEDTANGQLELSSVDLMKWEHDYSAHNYHPIPVVFDRAEGAKVWDVEGKEYIDMLAAYGAVNQGHAHPRLLATLQTQASKLTLSSRAFYNSVFPVYARKITSLTGFDMVLPMNTGAEAVESALKLARKWGYIKKHIPEGRARILACGENFHGRTLGVISMSTDPSAREEFGPYLPLVGPSYVDKQGQTKTVAFNNIPDLEAAFEAVGEETAAFLVEPVQGEAGIVVPDDGYLKRVRELCDQYKVLLICDEIQSGLCRTGKFMCYEWDGIKPDILLLGKALSGGMYPVSAVLADRDVMLCIKPGEHGSTYGGNPLGAALAITALDILIDENLADRALHLGEIFRSGIRSLNSPFVKEVRGRGLFNAVVIDDSKSTKGRTAWDLCILLKERGVLAKPTHHHIIRFAPPLVIGESDIYRALSIIGAALDEFDTIGEIPAEPSFTGTPVIDHVK